jgi:hypothetical protein
MAISIGSFRLDDENYSVISNVSFEYFKTESGEIIGGRTIATVTGTVSVPDEDGSVVTGSIVMSKLKNIRDLGKITQCLNVSIPNFNPYNGQAKVTSVNIDQGPDPSWVNQGAFTIEVTGLLKEIPPNSFDIVASDGVVELSRSESIEIGEDSHDFIYSSEAAKSFIKFSNQLNLRCEPYCSDVNPIQVLRKIIKVGPTNKAFNEYNSWKKYLQSRSLNINTDGSISFNCDIILTPSSSPEALVDLEFSYSKVYEEDKITYVTSGSVVGLVSINWADIVDLPDTCSASKFANALGVYNRIHGRYSNLGAWAGSTIELEEKPNCPKEDETEDSIGRCGDDDDDDDDSNFIRPTSSRVTLSRTDGVINFNFEWSTEQGDDGKCITDGVTEEITVDIIEPQETYVEHILPGFGTLIQNLDCKSAKRISFTVSITYPESTCGKSKDAECRRNDGLEIIKEEYFGEDNYLLIGYKTTETNNTDITREDYILCRKS